MNESIQYYFWASYRRKALDKLLEKNKKYFRDIVLDIGGRDRGRFKKPRKQVKKWIFSDTEKRHNPDIKMDVADMSKIESESIDVVNAIELFEHVEKINEGLKECYRILKKGGNMILSAPFLYPIHADPNDFQRWTEEKWKNELTKLGFKIEKLVIMGRFFSVFADMVKTLINSLPRLISWTKYLLFPILDTISVLDKTELIKQHQKLSKYTTGYFIIAIK